ncbi:MAG: cupin domain-containing protein [Pseudomonadota bacterium]|nr:cupin domain-containing protein [Pseudomonadota bacterium]
MDDAYAVNVTEVAAFSADARVNQELMSTKDAIFHLNCHEPGLITPMHKHTNQDEVLNIVEGSVEVTFEVKETLTINTGDIVCLPADQYHSIQAGPDGRMMLLYFMRPENTSERRPRQKPFPAIKRLPGERG